MFCSRCGTERPAAAKECPQCGARFARPFRISHVLAAVVLVGLCGVAVKWGSHYAAVSRLNDKLQEAVGRDAGYTETILKVEAESASMTYVELFDLCEESIKRRTELVVELRGLYPDIDSDLRDALIEFLGEENELVRQKAAFYRKQLAMSASLKSLSLELADRPSSIYGISLRMARFEKLKIEVATAAADLITAGTEFTETYGALLDQERVVAERAEREGLRFLAVFKKYEVENVTKTNEAIEAVRALGT